MSGNHRQSRQRWSPRRSVHCSTNARYFFQTMLAQCRSAKSAAVAEFRSRRDTLSDDATTLKSVLLAGTTLWWRIDESPVPVTVACADVEVFTCESVQINSYWPQFNTYILM